MAKKRKSTNRNPRERGIRNINGKRYIRAHINPVSKKKAIKIKEDYKDTGKLARVIKHKRGYHVYMHYR